MRRRAAILVAAGACALLCAAAAIPRMPRLLWNTTASAPLGLYALRPARGLSPGDLVAVRPPAPLARVLAASGYLPLGVPLLKTIVALSPSIVCRRGAKVSVDGRAAAVARARDRFGRPLPAWSGCRRLAAGSVFLLNAEPNSLDSRYFGPLPTAGVMGRAAPLWTWKAR